VKPLLRWLGFWLFALSGSSLLAQDAAPFRYGTDPTGGAPFIYRKKGGDGYTGFEVEVAAYIANKLGREPVVVAGDWANLPQQLNKSPDVQGGVDVVLNGYELRRDLVSKFAATRPYYIYRLSLVTHSESPINDWDSLQDKSVGVLGGTVAHKYLRNRYRVGGRWLPLLSIDLKTNPDVANVIKLVNDQRMDATVQDSPAATHFLSEYPDLKLAGEPVQPGDIPGYYVMYYRKDDPIGPKLDEAISQGLSDGSFERIYKKYGLWNEDQESLAKGAKQEWKAPELPEEPSQWPELIGELVIAAGMTIFLATTSFPLAMLIGLSVAIGRLYAPWIVRVLCGLYVEVIRGTPLLLQLFVIYYLVPEVFKDLGIASWIEWLTPLRAGIMGLAINYSAYEAENYRAGLQAIPKGQTEAGLALGMSRITVFRRIVLPQAMRIVIPPVTNDFIALFKDTSACSILFVTELTRKYNELFNFNRDLIVELLVLTAGLYLLMSYPLALLAGWLERRLEGTK
jgi:polar amino acid transport system substrate-binding protein